MNVILTSLLVLRSHQQSRYWQKCINNSLSSMAGGLISTTWAMSVSRNIRTCKYVFMFPKDKTESISIPLVRGKCGSSFESIIFIHIIQSSWLSTRCAITLRWMPQHFTNEKTTWVEVMAWCRQASSHYLSQCRTNSISPYGVTRPRWVVWW